MTTTSAIENQIAKLEAKRADLAAASKQAEDDFRDAASKLLAEFERSGEDVEAVRELPALLKTYVAACRDYHRIVHGKRLSRAQEEQLPGLEDPVEA